MRSVFLALYPLADEMVTGGRWSPAAGDGSREVRAWSATSPASRNICGLPARDWRVDDLLSAITADVAPDLPVAVASLSIGYQNLRQQDPAGTVSRETQPQGLGKPRYLQSTL